MEVVNSTYCRYKHNKFTDVFDNADMEKQLEDLQKKNIDGSEKETSEKFTIMEEKLEVIVKACEEKKCI